jgi:uncharacterized protein
MPASPEPGLRLTELWRYPVKSMRGERLSDASLTRDGIPGDRLLHVRGARGPLTGRTRHDLLTISARTSPGGGVLVGDRPWDSPETGALVARAAGDGARLVHDDSTARFDVLPLLVATDAEIARLGVDRRRLRPNLVIGGAAPGAERDWPGQALRIGGAVIGVLSLRPRCIVTTIDPDTGAQDLDVLRRIRREFAGAVALDCWVVTPGRVRPDDPVEVVPLPDPLPPGGVPDPGGWITGRRYDLAGGSARTGS